MPWIRYDLCDVFTVADIAPFPRENEDVRSFIENLMAKCS